jgi:hypothetical protein
VIDDREFVRLRFEARHFLPGQVARLAGLALAAVRLGPSRLPPALLAAALRRAGLRACCYIWWPKYRVI